jgi:NADH-quinone oxidoreductase subunit L
VDARVIDGAVNGAGTVSQGVGGLLKRLQSGNIRSYAVWVLLGSVLVLVAMGLAAGGMR